MQHNKADIIAQLQKDILPLQGLKFPATGNSVNTGLGPIENAFSNSIFPVGAVHEFLSAGSEDAAATGGFIAGILAALMRNGGASVWISASRTIFPPALKTFDIEPDKIIFIDLQKEKDVLWAMEEALKCNGLAAVVGEIKEISFTASRRLQLAVEQSAVTGFILRHSPRNLNTIACVSRWKITSLPSALEDDMPGLGFPRWNVELLKIRNGKPGKWQMEWKATCFHHISPLITSIPQEQKRKTG
jgi:protein ImuA